MPRFRLKGLLLIGQPPKDNSDCQLGCCDKNQNMSNVSKLAHYPRPIRQGKVGSGADTNLTKLPAAPRPFVSVARGFSLFYGNSASQHYN
jgi:hypothetical protein